MHLDPARVRVHREQSAELPSALRRLDITIDGGDRAIILENKPWAMEQPDQIRGYVDHAVRYYGDRFVLLFLTPSGREPQSIPAEAWSRLVAAGQAGTIAYNGAVRRWLEDCIRECQADRVRWFLRDFAGYLAEKFGDGDEEEVVDPDSA